MKPNSEEIEKISLLKYPINIQKVCGKEYDYNSLERKIWVDGFNHCLSISPSPVNDAVEFAEWLCNNEVLYSNNTIKEQYEIFKKEK